MLLCFFLRAEERMKYKGINKTLRMILLCIILPLNVMADQQDEPWQAGTILSEQTIQTMGVSNCFTAEPIPDAVFVRMQGKSWKTDCLLKRSDYRYLKILHRNAEGKSQMGEMICNKGIAKKLLKIFRQLYDADYRIERMVLIDHYDADDERSMMANNTTCFNYRVVKGSSKLSAHARGVAIDINPLYNPYVKKGRQGTVIQPKGGKKYAYHRDRRRDIPYKIDRNDLAYKLFTAQGFKWGGNWNSLKDFQHFEL